MFNRPSVIAGTANVSGGLSTFNSPIGVGGGFTTIQGAPLSTISGVPRFSNIGGPSVVTSGLQQVGLTGVRTSVSPLSRVSRVIQPASVVTGNQVQTIVQPAPHTPTVAIVTSQVYGQPIPGGNFYVGSSPVHHTVSPVHHTVVQQPVQTTTTTVQEVLTPQPTATTTVVETTAPANWERPAAPVRPYRAGYNRSGFSDCCPWWLWLLLGLLLLGLLAFGLLKWLGNGAASDTRSTTSRDTRISSTSTTEHCEEGYFMSNGKCLKCPGPSTWNGTDCVYKKKVAVN
jgi:hypothetical protein